MTVEPGTCIECRQVGNVQLRGMYKGLCWGCKAVVQVSRGVKRAALEDRGFTPTREYRHLLSPGAREALERRGW